MGCQSKSQEGDQMPISVAGVKPEERLVAHHQATWQFMAKPGPDHWHKAKVVN